MLELYGPNTVSSEGDTWRFHVRVTSPPFGESNNQLVWSETVRQTGFLVQAWARSGSRNLKEEIFLLSLNVISAAGFGKQLSWEGSDKQIPQGHSMSFLESLTIVVDYLGVILLLPKWVIRRSPWKKAAHAFAEFENYMRELIAAEKENISHGFDEDIQMRGNLLTAMLKASAIEGKGPVSEKGTKKSYFSDNEVLGKLSYYLSQFTNSFLGYDTSATTITYGAIMLALYSDVQDRVLEEVDRVFHEALGQGRNELDYDLDYPKLKYTLAFMVRFQCDQATTQWLTDFLVRNPPYFPSRHPNSEDGPSRTIYLPQKPSDISAQRPTTGNTYPPPELSCVSQYQRGPT